jgi:hypothetical protein
LQNCENKKEKKQLTAISGSLSAENQGKKSFLSYVSLQEAIGEIRAIHPYVVCIPPSGTWQNEQAGFWNISVEMVPKREIGSFL